MSDLGYRVPLIALEIVGLSVAILMIRKADHPWRRNAWALLSFASATALFWSVQGFQRDLEPDAIICVFFGGFTTYLILNLPKPGAAPAIADDPHSVAIGRSLGRWIGRLFPAPRA